MLKLSFKLLSAQEMLKMHPEKAILKIRKGNGESVDQTRQIKVNLNLSYEVYKES